jgi:hypothetical protein
MRQASYESCWEHPRQDLLYQTADCTQVYLPSTGLYCSHLHSSVPCQQWLEPRWTNLAALFPHVSTCTDTLPDVLSCTTVRHQFTLAMNTKLVPSI